MSKVSIQITYIEDLKDDVRMAFTEDSAEAVNELYQDYKRITNDDASFPGFFLGVFNLGTKELELNLQRQEAIEHYKKVSEKKKRK